jgi:iron complex transport system ATP-binding protein
MMDYDSTLKLSVNQVDVSYKGRQVLHQVSATVSPGELVVLIGPNGVGKSTLIKAVSGSKSIDAGTIRIDGQDLIKMDPQGRARLVSVIPQARNLPPAFTTREVVQMGRTPYVGWLGQLSRQDADIIEQSMTRTNIIDLADRMMGELSGGEQQRVLVARALAQQPKLLLLDEPTTHLDIQYQISLLDLILKLAHEDHIAILMAIHDLNMAAHYAERILLMVDGRIASEGTTGQVMTSEVLSAVYRVPITLHTDQSGTGWFLPY